MRAIINHIRSWFCAHEFTFDETDYKTRGPFGMILRDDVRVSRTCKKCGWHKSYWKF